MKRRGAGGLLDVLKAQHLDSGVSLARRLGILLSRFSKIGSTNYDPQIVTGTIGRVVNAFLMQLVASPSTRPAYGHLWGVGGVPALYNGDGTATPILDAWADPDSDVAPLTVDIGTQTISSGAYGVIVKGTEESSQALLFFAAPSGTVTISGWNDFGNGSMGSLTAPTDTTSWAHFAESFLTSGGNGLPYGVPDGTYLHYFGGIASSPSEILATDLTIPSGVIVVVASASGGGGGQGIVRAGGTLTVNGELSSSGDHWALYDHLKGSVSQSSAGGAGGSNANGSTAPFFPQGMPYDEGGFSGDTTKYSGTGGSAGSNTGGAGQGAGYPPVTPGSSVGFAGGTGGNARTFPGTANCGLGIGIEPYFGCGGGGGAGSAGVGGRGGYGAYMLTVCAATIAGTGKITSNGGRGMPGVSGNGGGGGGGDPGGLSVVTNSTPTPTLQTNPGVGGAGVGTGSAGTSGGGVGYQTVRLKS